MHIEEDGSVTPCCVMPSNRFPMGSNIENYLSGDALKNLKQDLLNNIKNPNCEWCWDNEKNNMSSHRRQLAISSDGLTHIHLRLNNVCNFKCRMCWPKDSSLWATDWKKVEQFYDAETRDYINNVAEVAGNKRLYNMYETNERFVDKLLKCLENVEEIEFAGGEPLLDPIHYRVLNNIKNPERVTLNTALTYIN